MERIVDRKRKREAKKQTKTFKARMVANGASGEAVDTIIKDNPDIVKETLTYAEVIKAYDQASAATKYTRDILLLAQDSKQHLEGINREQHDLKLKAGIVNINEILEEHLTLLSLVETYRSRGDAEVGYEDSIDMANIATRADLTLSVTEEIQVVAFMTLLPEAGMTVADIGGV